MGIIVNPTGGNVAVLRNDAGSLIVDSNYKRFRKEYTEAFKSFAGDSPRFMINTHWHGDHTGNNDMLREQGALIVSHAAVRARLAGDAGVEGRTGQDIPAAALAEVTFDEQMGLNLGGERIEIRHYGPGHTDGDGVVWFKTSKVVHMGDLFFNGGFPFIDLGAGGDVRGYVAVVGEVLAELEEAGSEWRVIPGHGAICGADDLRAFHEMLEDCVARVEEALAAGDGVEQMLEVDILAGYESWAAGFINTKRMVETLATGLDAK